MEPLLRGRARDYVTAAPVPPPSFRTRCLYPSVSAEDGRTLDGDHMGAGGNDADEGRHRGPIKRHLVSNTVPYKKRVSSALVGCAFAKVAKGAIVASTR